MLFHSFEYIFVFLPLVALLYFWIVKASDTAAKLFLLGASLFFYAWWNIYYLPLLVSSITVNYAIGSYIGKASGRSDTLRKTLLTAGILFNLCLLGYYKYTNFLISVGNSITGNEWTALDLILPLAISFFTFQQIAYLVDSFKGQVKEYSWLNYFVFVAFFPQLIAGPICHHRKLVPQFARTDNKIFNADNVALGLSIFIAGLFKKTIVADYLAVWVNGAHDSAMILDQSTAWIASFAYSFQLYFDFSGYSDMAIGAALIFNIKLPTNFNSPYKSANIREIWRRWHMTLGDFVTRYVFGPLGATKNGQYRGYFNLFISFVVIGIWHGAGWTYVIFGLLHGSAVVINQIWKDMNFSMPKWLAILITFNLWNISLIIFRSKDMDTAMLFYDAMFQMPAFALPPEAQLKQMGIVIALLFVVWFVPNTGEIFSTATTKKNETWWQWNPNKLWAVGFGLISVFMMYYAMLDSSPAKEFLYFQF